MNKRQKSGRLHAQHCPRRNGALSVTESSPVTAHSPSWLHLIKGSRRGPASPQQVASGQGPWCSPGRRWEVGPSQLWGCSRCTGTLRQVPPLAGQHAPHSAHGISGKGRPFPPRISSPSQPSHRPQSSWPSPRPPLTPTTSRTRRSGRAILWTSTTVYTTRLVLPSDRAR